MTSIRSAAAAGRTGKTDETDQRRSSGNTGMIFTSGTTSEKKLRLKEKHDEDICDRYRTGNQEYMTPQARSAIERAMWSWVILFMWNWSETSPKGKEGKSTAMKQEVDRCRMAPGIPLSKGKPWLSSAAGMPASTDSRRNGGGGGRSPGSGDRGCAGYYGCLQRRGRFGRPADSRFAVISLSDLLTPWGTDRKRLSLAAEADFVICLYNPRTRRDTIISIRRRYQPQPLVDTPCGYVKKHRTDEERR